MSIFGTIHEYLPRSLCWGPGFFHPSRIKLRLGIQSCGYYSFCMHFPNLAWQLEGRTVCRIIGAILTFVPSIIGRLGGLDSSQLELFAIRQLLVRLVTVPSSTAPDSLEERFRATFMWSPRKSRKQLRCLVHTSNSG